MQNGRKTGQDHRKRSTEKKKQRKNASKKEKDVKGKLQEQNVRNRIFECKRTYCSGCGKLTEKKDGCE